MTRFVRFLFKDSKWDSLNNNLSAKRRIGSARNTMMLKKQVWAVGGGKGGVGKSFITSNLGIALSRKGGRVLLVDADLGAANLHTLVGPEKNRFTVSGFLKGEFGDIRRTINRTRVPNLDIISGERDSLDVANLNGSRIAKLKEALRRLDHDHILLDIGPGTSNNTLDLFLTADEGILVTTPEPTSIENTYRFLKCLFLRRMKHILDAKNGGRLKSLLKQVLYNRDGLRRLTVAGILDELRKLDSSQEGTLKMILGNTNISVLINQARRAEDKALGPSIRKACYDYFGLKVDYIGHVSYGDCVGDSVRYRKPLALNYKNSEPAKDMETVLRNMLRK